MLTALWSAPLPFIPVPSVASDKSAGSGAQATFSACFSQVTLVTKVPGVPSTQMVPYPEESVEGSERRARKRLRSERDNQGNTTAVIAHPKSIGETVVLIVVGIPAEPPKQLSI